MGISNLPSPLATLRSSFSRKLATLFVIVLVLIAGIGGVIYLQTGMALQESTEQNMEQSTVLQANTVSEWVDQMQEKTRYLAESEPVATGDQSTVTSYLEDEQQASAGTITGIHYYDTTDHTVLASTANEASGTDYRDAGVDWASGSLSFDDTRQTLVTNPYDDPVTETNAIAFVSQVPDDPTRAIIMSVDLETQSQQLERPSAVDGSFTHIVDSRGTVVMSHHIDDINTQNMGPADEYGVDSTGVERGLAGETGYVEMELGHGHHDQMAMGFTPVPETDWVIMTHIPVESAYALQGDIERSVIVLVLASILGLGVVGVVIGRNTTRPIKQLAERASTLESGNLEADLETDRTDEIGQLYAAFDSMRVSLRDQIHEVEEARDRADRFNQHLEAKAGDYASVMRACGEGDLTQRMERESQSEAMTDIADEFNQMMTALEATVDRLSRFADEVAASSEQVTASTEEVRSASAQVTESIQEISDGAERQTDSLQAVTTELNALSTTTEQIAASSNSVADLAAQTADTGRKGQQAARDTIAGMNEVEADVERTIDAIESLETEIDQIDELTDVITEVAEQTNLLALNATIEATRANESSGGFSAVAAEVKELAAETKDAAEDIEARIADIKAETDRTTSEVRQTSDRIAQHQARVENTVDALEEIASYAAETSDGVQEISAATQQQAASTQEVVSMVDEAATISQETTAEAETVAAAGEEQTTALTEVSQSISTLSEQAATLSANLDEFETATDSASTTTDAGEPTPLSGDSDDMFSFAEHDALVDSDTHEGPLEDTDPSGEHQ